MINSRNFEKSSLSFLPAREGKINRQNMQVLTNTVINHQKRRQVSYQITYYHHSLHIYPCSFLFLYFVLNNHYLDHLIGSYQSGKANGRWLVFLLCLVNDDSPTVAIKSFESRVTVCTSAPLPVNTKLSLIKFSFSPCSHNYPLLMVLTHLVFNLI